ncbi:UNVERIFIED_CONTAM: hypothetical protein Sradi_3861900 [Sesamum radiatum]|uniref:Retrotransposon Copia-like N-terminal domain-containing protein n=1 Tax=Sesamum radiatum TaxID=300843 RepID=A0AAW2Q246_SESRA
MAETVLENKDNVEKLRQEVLKLHSSDHPGMTLVSVPLNKKNWIAWSRSVQIALGAKSKLSFIDGSCAKPVTTGEEHEQWRKTDCMVTSWLLNSISKDIVEAFMYTSSARAL